MMQRNNTAAAVATVLAISTAIAAAVAVPARSAPAPVRYHAFAADITAQRPAGEPRGFVAVLETAGSRSSSEALTERLLGEGVAVARIAVPQDRIVVPDKGACLDTGLWVHSIVKDAEHRLGLADYHVPIIAGAGDAAPLAAAAYDRAQEGLATALLTVAPVHNATLVQPLCGGAANSPDAARPAQDRSIALTSVEDPTLARALNVVLPPSRAALADIPITEVLAPGQAGGDTFVILYSGDGGWAGLDKSVAAELARRGYPVVGINSLQYFWTLRTPEGAAADLAAVMRHYEAKWNRPKVVLVGYSFGADALPFIYDRLPPARKAQVLRLDLIGLGPAADFQFHFASWLSVSNLAARPTVPFLDRLSGVPVRCIRGQSESESACPRINSPAIGQVVLPGDHHLNYDAKRVVTALLGA